tara:strand:+ start:1817 stop:3181 length:1365 start_codon:yes stop_codon:yes gene_type:complete
MKPFNQYYKLVNESNSSKLNTHLEHLEDELLNFGKEGASRIIEFIKGMTASLEGSSKKSYNFTTKWDGAPAIICGTDSIDDKFFVGTKSVGNKNKPIRIKMVHVDDATGAPWIRKTKNSGNKVLDIDYWYDEQPGLKEKLQLAWNYLRHLNLKDFMLQGDLLYTPGSIKTARIPDSSGNVTEYIKFRANTITYAVPTDSELARKILKSKIGIVFHTMYIGDWDNITTKFDFDKHLLEVQDEGDPEAPGILYKGVWFDDANFKDVSGQVNLTDDESKDLHMKLQEVIKYHGQTGDVYKFLKGDECKDLAVEMKAHINYIIRDRGVFERDPNEWANQFTERYVQRTEASIAKLKTEAGQTRKRNELQACVNFIEQNLDDIHKFYILYLLVIDMKLVIMNKLKRLSMLTDTFIENEDGTFSVTEPEGYVAVDHDGSAVKIVDRLEFSRLNFMPKNFG